METIPTITPTGPFRMALRAQGIDDALEAAAYYLGWRDNGHWPGVAKEQEEIAV